MLILISQKKVNESMIKRFIIYKNLTENLMFLLFYKNYIFNFYLFRRFSYIFNYIYII